MSSVTGSGVPDSRAGADVSAQSPALAFRKDLHALRAWAVVAVVGYHFGVPGFASGFVGVDIFFVLSGYLITAQALAAMAVGRFSFAAFWTARLRRLAPALCVVLVATVLLGWWLTLPGQYLQHLRQMLFAVTFSSNFPFASQQGYFDAAAHTKPLLHTWSLSIEWQFYLVMPLVLSGAWRLTAWRFTPTQPERAARSLNGVMLVLAVVAIASLGYCLAISSSQASQGFFSLRARAWELLVGSLVAGWHASARRLATAATPAMPTRLKRGAWVLGWCGIALTALLPMPVLYWPGAWTVLPVAAAGLMVWGTQPTNPSALVNRVLACWPVQRLGDWSYSIYLWHWPLWVFMLAWLGPQEGKPSADAFALYQGALLLAALALGAASTRYIEQPTRSRLGWWTAKRLWVAYGITVLALFGVTVLGIKTHGFDSRVPDYLRRAEDARRLNTPRDECFRNARSEKRDPAQFCSFGSPAATAQTSAMLWGDSVAGQFLMPISAAASQLGIHGLIATQSGCRALLADQSAGVAGFEGCTRFNTEVNAYLQQHTDPRIIIVGRNWGNTQGSVDEAFRVVKHLLATGRTVVLILPMLNLDFDVSERWIREQRLAGHAIDEMTIPATPELVFKTARDAIALQMRELAGNARLITVDVLPHICSDGFCSLVHAGQANFRDTLHISNINADQYEPFFVRGLQLAIEATTTARR